MPELCALAKTLAHRSCDKTWVQSTVAASGPRQRNVAGMLNQLRKTALDQLDARRLVPAHARVGCY